MSREAGFSPFGDLGRRIGGSLALRWALVVTLVAGTGLALMVHAVGTALRAKIDAESARLTEIAEQKVSDRLDIEARLGDQRMRALVTRSEAALQDLASQTTLLRLLRERDERRIAERLQADLQRIGFTGGMVLDQNLLPVGMDRADLSLAQAERALQGLDFREALQNILSAHHRRTPVHYRALSPMGLGLELLFQAPIQDRYGLISAVPIFDEFGDPAGLILAYRLLQPSETALTDFAQTIRAGVALMRGDMLITRAGDVPEGFQPRPPGPRPISPGGSCAA